MKIPYLKLSIIPASVLIALLVNTPVWADSASAIDPPRVCEITGKGAKSLTIVAGPDLTFSAGTALAADFPEAVACGSDTCSKWNFRYIWNKINPSLAYADMSADLALISTSSTGQIHNSLGPNNVDTRWLRWTANQDTFDASFITPTAIPRIASVGGKSGNFEGFCAILGAGVPTQQENRAQDTLVAEKTVRASDGSEICTRVDPFTQCEFVIDCETGEPLPDSDAIPLEDILDANGLEVIEVSVPGQACPTFVTNDGLPDTRYYCSGGFCWVF